MQLPKLPHCNEFDRDLLRRVKAFLHQRGYGPHRTLEICVERGVVVVQGRLPAFYLRQVAIECIKRVAGVTQVVDLIEVTERDGQPQANDDAEESHKSFKSSVRHSSDVSQKPRNITKCAATLHL